MSATGLKRDCARRDTGPIDPDRVIARYFRDTDYPALAEFLVRAFGTWPAFAIPVSVQEHLEWKANCSPQIWGEQVLACLRECDSEIIALGIRIVRPVWVRGELYEWLSEPDTSVHPDWRRLGVRDKRDEFREKEGNPSHDIGPGFLPHHPVTRAEALKNPPVANLIRVYWHTRSVRTFVSVPLRSAGPLQLLRNTMSRLSGRFRRQQAPPVWPGTIEPVARFDDRTDALWEAVAPTLDLAIARRQDYMNWRYADPRGGDFAIRAAVDQDGTRVLGYCVSKASAARTEIVDLLVQPDRLDVLRALVADVLARFDDRADAPDASGVTCWLPQRHPYVPVLRLLGFFDSGRDLGFYYEVREANPDLLDFLDDPAARLHITQGDSDLV